MPSAGGASDKFGNYYEGLWTVDCMLDILDEQANSIHLEPFEEEGFEFSLHKLENHGVKLNFNRNGIYEYHQVKTKSTGRWTISKLEDDKIKVLSNFQKKLDQSAEAECVFISNNSASELSELTKKAKNYQDWEEFTQTAFNTKEWRKHFSTLCSKWNHYPSKEIEEAIEAIGKGRLSDNQHIVKLASNAYEYLKRIQVETINKNQLNQKLEIRIRSLVEKTTDEIFCGDQWWSNVVDILAQFALHKVQHKLKALDIWHHLNDRGFQRREWGINDRVLGAVEKCNNIYTNLLQNSIPINNQIIPRDETQTILDSLNDSETKDGVLLVGEAGIGKSGVMLQIVEKLKQQNLPKQNLPILVFRVDTLKQPTPNPDQVGKDLGLPASPAIVIANIAQSHNRKGILVIDQLDAVSLASGRNPEFFDCILNIIEQAKQLNLHIVLACRKFDLDNDKRLNKLTGEKGIVETVTIKSLTEKKVKEIVNSLGLDASRLNQKQIKLLSLPLHLGLLAETVKDSTIDTLNFETANDLFAQYWISKQRDINKRLACPIQWTQVVDKLCNYMTKKQQQTLSAPESIVDEYLRDVEVMVSEHILVKENKRLRFFHESFFDYAFARRFAGREKDLLSFLKEDEQHLFKRAQVRQILVNERDENFEQYLDDLTELLNSDDIRFHIKELVLALLSTFKQPTEKEWDIIAPFIEDLQNPLYKTARSILFSTAWFNLLDSLGIIEKWLKDENEQRIEQTVSLLGVMQRELPERVAELLEPFVGVSDVWYNHFIYLIEHTELHTNRRFFELFLQLIDQGILDEARDTVESNGDFWGLIYFRPFKKNPNWICEVIGKYLNRRLDLYEKRLEENSSKLNINPFKSYYPQNDLGTIEDTQHDRIFLESAKQSPQSFVTNVFPFMMRVIELTSDQKSNPPWKDGVWRYIIYGVSYGIDEKLLQATEIALSNLAKNNPKDFSEFIEKKQLRSSNFETIQYLLIRAYKANGDKFADEAAKYICKNPARLKTGYSAGNGNIHAAPYWATRELLEAITPHCAKKNLNKLEELILDYYPDWEKHRNYRQSRGYAQCVLLDGIDSSRLSDKANRRLQELKRKFQLEKTEKIKSPEFMKAGPVLSPIPHNDTEKMTDEQWLKAMKKYSSYDDETRELEGGARELSSELEKQVKKNPVRFAKLIHKFPDEANTAYFDAVLRGIAKPEVEINLSTALSVCQRCHQLPKKPCGRWISWVFYKLDYLPWTPNAMDMLICYALYDPNPKEEVWQKKVDGDKYYYKVDEDNYYYGGNPLDAGINSTRGSAVSAIAKLIFADKNRTAYCQSALEQIVKDSSIAVKSCAAKALIAVLNYDRNLAVKLFLKLCNTKEDILLGTSTIKSFLYYALETHFQQLEAILTRMINSHIEKVQEVAATQIFRISLRNKDAQTLAQNYISKGKIHRKAAALVYASNLHLTEYKEFCEKALIDLFNDTDEEVYSAAAGCFNSLERNEQELINYANLIEKFIESEAFKKNAHQLIYLLRNNPLIDTNSTTSHKLLYKLCKKYIEMNDSKIGYEGISKILIQIYSKTKDKEFQSKCLDLIDNCYKIENYSINKVITNNYDHL